jgi:hypothetical protein
MFLNCTAHELTQDQIGLARDYSQTIVDLKADNINLHTKLVNCPPEIGVIHELVIELLDYLKVKYLESENNLTVHLPIGSPAFMAVFFMTLDRKILPFRIVFSHSDRVSIDEKQADGSIVKRAVFKFIKFIEI